MKHSYYLSTYLFINELAFLTDIDLRHDMNVSLWKKTGDKIDLLRYWELERVTGLKQHRKAFYDVNQAKMFINELLKEFDLTLNDIEEVWGTPELSTGNDLDFMEQFPEYCHHSMGHMFGSVLMDSEIFFNEKIVSIVVDGAPDNVIELLENMF
ncbi:MAG: hypothetical protein ACRDA4_08710 [Filifactoraceae bacterium]